MSRYYTGRRFEKLAEADVRKLGLNCVRVPLSKGFYIVTRNDMYTCYGDLAAWCYDGLPVSIEVKRIGKTFKSDKSFLKLLRSRLVSYRHRKLRVFVMAYTKRGVRYFVYDATNGKDKLLEYDSSEFAVEVANTSRKLAQQENNGYVTFAILPIGD